MLLQRCLWEINLPGHLQDLPESAVSPGLRLAYVLNMAAYPHVGAAICSLGGVRSVRRAGGLTSPRSRGSRVAPTRSLSPHRGAVRQSSRSCRGLTAVGSAGVDCGQSQLHLKHWPVNYEPTPDSAAVRLISHERRLIIK